MINEQARSDALAFYARIGAALFPIPRGSKDPTGIISSFAHDHSADPAMWRRWATEFPGCNFGLVAGPSNLVICDVDLKDGREAAWASWVDLCRSWGIEPIQPTIQSARGGWHILLKTPEGVDARSLRQPDAVRGKINVRAANGYVVAAGSFYDGTAKGEQSGPYVLLNDGPLHEAPAALIAHCTRRATKPSGPSNIGTRDKGDVAALVNWLHEREQFNSYEDWVALGMSLRVEFGDAGFELWELATWPDALDAARAKWDSFATDATAGSVTLSSFLDRAHKMGWRGSVRKATSAMFDGVAQIAAAAGAALPGTNPMPMVAGQQALCDIGAPILAEFMADTSESPSRPHSLDYPAIPEAAAGHGLYAPLQSALQRIFAMAETKGFKSSRCTAPFALLTLVHPDTMDAVRRKMLAMGHPLPDRNIKWMVASISDRVERVFVKQDDWIYDAKTGNIEGDNPDNLVVFLGVIDLEVRYNAWLERIEVKGGNDPELHWDDWTYLDDPIVAKLRMRALRTKTRFKMTKEFAWDALTAEAHKNTVDPVLDRLDELERNWDGCARLSTWLSRSCGVECDIYHQAVARNLIGGICKRIREPGSKHDTMAVFHGPQGPGKSTMAAVIADLGVSPLAAILSRSSPWFTDTVLLGAESKELVLALAGKTVAEIGEMGMRGTTNANLVKAMVSRQVDEGRTAYARAVTARPRRNIFIGTVNGDEPLTDPTGNRRFLPVAIHNTIDLEWLSENIGQIVGEAARLHSAGTSFDLPASVWGIAAEHQEAARSESDIEIKFAEWFAPQEHTAVAYVTASDLVDACLNSKLRTNSHGAYMKRFGFIAKTGYIAGKNIRVWYRGPFGPMQKDAVRYVFGRTADGRTRWEIRRE